MTDETTPEPPAEPAPTTSVTGLDGVLAKTAITAGQFLGAGALAILATRMFLPFRWAFGLWAAVAAAVLGGAALRSVPTDGLRALATPADGVESAMARWKAVEARDETGIHQRCRSIGLFHDGPTETCVVLIHGISSSPYQYAQLAPLLHERGHNVIAPRLPWHGLEDLATGALRHLRAEELRDAVDEACDIAAGLGRRTVVLGVSAGGVLAEFAGQGQDVHRAVMVSPSFGLAGFGPRGNWYAVRLLLTLPSVSIWKDPVRRKKAIGLGHNYLRQSTRGFAEIMRLGLASKRFAVEDGIAGGSVALVTSANDASVDLGEADEVADRWEQAGKPTFRYEYPASSGLGHDLVDPKDPASDPDVVYPLLLELVEGDGLPEPPAG